ncbi:MAG: S-layer homology domain-containing protein [Kastovskya adunca ATA6-11-RM4]|jgi:hypothetical protein|nr:S-layer homology domain-containing protein [Kastovskya adunca ATA6-11-RM4]
MSSFSRWTSRSAGLLALGLTASAIAPLVVLAPATAATFVDVQSHWARPFIEALAQENIIDGYSDRTFRPDQPVTRAQFNAMVQQAFDENNVMLPRKFDIEAANYWSSRDFGSTSSTRQLRASDPLSRGQVLVSLVNGLRLNASGSTANTLNVYRDASKIPNYARDSIAVATQKGFVVNYPNVTYLEPTKVATRADVAAFIHQALANEGVLAPISSRAAASNYIVRVTPGTTQATNSGTTQTTNSGTSQSTTSGSNNQVIVTNPSNRTPQYKVSRGTAIDVEYLNSDRVVVAPGETMKMTLVVAKEIKNSRGEILIPANSQIEGQLVPRYEGSRFLGTQFVAQRLMVGDRVYTNLNATSPLVTGEKAAEVQSQIPGGAAVSAAARAILGTVLGGGVRGAGNILGTILGRNPSPQQTQTQNTLIIIDPEKDLKLTLGSDFYVEGAVSSSR